MNNESQNIILAFAFAMPLGAAGILSLLFLPIELWHLVVQFVKRGLRGRRRRAQLAAFTSTLLALSYVSCLGVKTDLQKLILFDVICLLQFGTLLSLRHLVGRPLWEFYLSEKPKYISGKEFYSSKEWLDLRYRVLRKHGRTCMLCRRSNGQMHVDHIKPRSRYPSLALEFSNLQVLCKDCNLGKSNKYEDDFRAG